MAKFHTLKISDVRKETKDTVSVAFEVPEVLKSDYEFIQGQYLTLKIDINGEEIRRSYSICSSPITDSELRVAVKTVEGGKMSTYLNTDSKLGDSIEVMTPMGNFYSVLDKNNIKNYLLFAGGSGITPMMSILKSVLEVEADSTVTLIYANRDEDSIIFLNQLNSIEREFSNRFKIIHNLDQSIKWNLNASRTGLMTPVRVDAILTEEVNLKEMNEIFVCGPAPLMDNIINTLEKKGVEKHKIHVEYFTTVLKDIEAAEVSLPSADEFSGTSKITVVIDGDETDFELDTNGETILDASMDEGLDVPFACKGAVCCTCKAKVMEGSARMEMNYALDESEVEEGYILTCQAHPTSEKIVVDYDEI